MNITVRLAREDERSEIALCIAEGFERDFSFFRKDMNIVAKALESGIRSERFYVALYNDNIVGVQVFRIAQAELFIQIGYHIGNVLV